MIGKDPECSYAGGRCNSSRCPKHGTVATMAKRAHHPSFAPDGSCTRCGLGRRFGSICPPGFWMTKRESETWQGMTPKQRTAFEASLLHGEGEKR
jgi:hypothetical protein